MLESLKIEHCNFIRRSCAFYELLLTDFYLTCIKIRVANAKHVVAARMRERLKMLKNAQNKKSLFPQNVEFYLIMWICIIASADEALKMIVA